MCNRSFLNIFLSMSVETIQNISKRRLFQKTWFGLSKSSRYGSGFNDFGSNHCLEEIVTRWNQQTDVRGHWWCWGVKGNLWMCDRGGTDVPYSVHCTVYTVYWHNLHKPCALPLYLKPWNYGWRLDKESVNQANGWMVGNASPRLEYWFLPVDNLERSTGQPFSNIACKERGVRPFLEVQIYLGIVRKKSYLCQRLCID